MNSRMFLPFLFIMLAIMTTSFAQNEEAMNKKESVKNPIVKIQTSLGDIEVELNQDKAPNTVSNFLRYVRSGYYSNTLFHRVIKGFMIQGGGFTPDFKPKESGVSINNEADNGLKNARGTIAMARTSDPDSASTQFFINLANNPFLDYRSKTPDGWGYAVFGHVISGMDVVDKIANVKTGTHQVSRKEIHSDVPLDPGVVILSIKEETPFNQK
jgi:peptidyl-prolyl cis-trans isomerase B (cyclophilin B)